MTSLENLAKETAGVDDILTIIICALAKEGYCQLRKPDQDDCQSLGLKL